MRYIKIYQMLKNPNTNSILYTLLSLLYKLHHYFSSRYVPSNSTSKLKHESWSNTLSITIALLHTKPQISIISVEFLCMRASGRPSDEDTIAGIAAALTFDAHTVHLFQISYGSASSRKQWPGRMTWASERWPKCVLNNEQSWRWQWFSGGGWVGGWWQAAPAFDSSQKHSHTTSARARSRHRVNTLTGRDDVFITCNRGNVAQGFIIIIIIAPRPLSGLFSLDTAPPLD